MSFSCPRTVWLWCGCGVVVVWLCGCVVVWLCPKTGCIPAGHQSLLALHPDPSALAGALLVQHETSFGVSMLLLPRAWGETATLPRALPGAAPPTSPFMALLTDSLAVKAQARFLHCSSLSFCGAAHFADPEPLRSDH